MAEVVLLWERLWERKAERLVGWISRFEDAHRRDYTRSLKCLTLLSSMLLARIFWQLASGLQV